jgi:hypothetical protein
MEKPTRDRRASDRRTGDKLGQERKVVATLRAYLCQSADSRLLAELRAA